MSILSVFKKKETPVEQAKAVAPEKKEKTTQDLSQFKGVKENVLIRPIVTEKSAMLNGDGKYTFVIADYASKQEVKDVVEKRFKVHVEKVNAVTVHPKKRMRGAIEGRISGYRKAVVFVRTGETIDLTK